MRFLLIKLILLIIFLIATGCSGGEASEDPSLPNINREESNSNSINLKLMVDSGFRIDKDQSFDIDLENWGDVRFIPGATEINGRFKLRAYLLDVDGNIVYEFPEYYGNEISQLESITAVSFVDVDGDGLKDIVIISEYTTGVGESRVIPFPVAGIYYQRGTEFITIPEIDEKIYFEVKNVDVATVVNFARQYFEVQNRVDDIDSKADDLDDNKKINDFIMKYADSVEYRDEEPHRDAESFKSLIDQFGIYSITYFIDERDRNVVLHLYSDEIRDDLVLANSKKVGITITSLPIESEMILHSSDYLNNISFDVDWRSNDEEFVESKLHEIVETCKKIIMTNNEDIPQVFVLKDNYFAFTISGIAPEPYLDFTGDWIIFERMDGEYKLRAIMKFT